MVRQSRGRYSPPGRDNPSRRMCELEPARRGPPRGVSNRLRVVPAAVCKPPVGLSWSVSAVTWPRSPMVWRQSQTFLNIIGRSISRTVDAATDSPCDPIAKALPGHGASTSGTPVHLQSSIFQSSNLQSLHHLGQKNRRYSSERWRNPLVFGIQGAYSSLMDEEGRR